MSNYWKKLGICLICVGDFNYNLWSRFISCISYVVVFPFSFTKIMGHNILFYELKRLPLLMIIIKHSLVLLRTEIAFLSALHECAIFLLLFFCLKKLPVLKWDFNCLDKISFLPLQLDFDLTWMCFTSSTAHDNR